jgi:Ca2+-binding EF-hand superfamily protein
MGVYPTEEELNDMMKLISFDRETFNYYDFITFMSLAMDYLHLQEEPNMILLKSEKRNGFMTLQERSTDKLDDMFKMFANEQTGTVTRDSYLNALHNMGESITSSEVDALFQEIGSDELSFDDFVHYMQNITFHSL